MKKIQVIMLVFLALNNIICFAGTDSSQQSKDTRKLKSFYGTSGFGGGFKGASVSIAFSIITKKNWGVTWMYFGNLYPSNKPKDYKPASGLFVNFFGSSGHEYSSNRAQSGAVLLVKELPAVNKNIRIEFAAGPSFGSHQQYYFKSIPEERGSNYTPFSWYSGNYNVTTVKNVSMGLFLKSSIGYLPSKFFCTQLSVFGNLDTQHSYAGVQLEFLFGKLRYGRKKK